MILRAAALGAATGCRSSMGLASLALNSHRDDHGLAGWLAAPPNRIVHGLLAVGEMATDKHPAIPDRTDAPGLMPRLGVGLVSGSALARRGGVGGAMPALIAGGAALATAFAGVRLRTVARRRFGSDLPGALVEDATAVLLAWSGTRRRR